MDSFMVWGILMTMWSVQALDNGLARTPPMGFLSWERFLCNVDCVNDPENCISENLYKRIADEMVAGGYKDAGYEYVCIDDCWLAKERDSNDRLQPDPARFPNGMKNLSDYIHSKGLKLGIYEDFGTKTCAGYPGSEFYLQIDAQTFADWGVDLLKFDGCNSDYHDMDAGYPIMSKFLQATGRPILFSCEWPLHFVMAGKTPDYKRVKEYCNTWRNYDDIDDSWDSVKHILDFYFANKGDFAQVAGPGGFNDPDELVVGDFGLSYDQQKAQFGMWAIMASPLLMSVDLRTIDPRAKAILLNRDVIAINQDPRGAQALPVWKDGSLSFWLKPLQLMDAYALAFLNYAEQGGPRNMTVPLASLGLTGQTGYNVTELFDGTHMGIYKQTQNITISVNPSGILLLKAVPLM